MKIQARSDFHFETKKKNPQNTHIQIYQPKKFYKHSV